MHAGRGASGDPYRERLVAQVAGVIEGQEQFPLVQGNAGQLLENPVPHNVHHDLVRVVRIDFDVVLKTEVFQQIDRFAVFQEGESQFKFGQFARRVFLKMEAVRIAERHAGLDFPVNLLVMDNVVVGQIIAGRDDAAAAVVVVGEVQFHRFIVHPGQLRVIFRYPPGGHFEGEDVSVFAVRRRGENNIGKAGATVENPVHIVEDVPHLKSVERMLQRLAGDVVRKIGKGKVHFAVTEDKPGQGVLDIADFQVNRIPALDQIALEPE